MNDRKILLEKPAQKFLERLSLPDKERLIKAIMKLPDGDVKSLKGYRDVFRLRVGTYRVIYSITADGSLITVLIIGNRGDIYKKY